MSHSEVTHVRTATSVAASVSSRSGAPASETTLPVQAITTEVLIEKYAKGSETTSENVNRRVAHALAQAEREEERSAWEAKFLTALEGGFIPAGRIQSAAGTDLRATLINCFVQPVGDAIVETENGHPGIYTALAEAAETMRRGGGVGYDFSRIRPSGAHVKTTQSSASGPVSYMRVFDRSCETVESAGARRGAQMGVMRCDHPDIEAFIHAKDKGDLKNFNISVGVSDAFMKSVQEDGDVELIHTAEPSEKVKAAGAYRREDGQWVYRVVKAAHLWDQIMRSTYDHAEPGVLFIDTMNKDNNLSYCETLAATNPCAEQPLPPYGCCCLGSINLTRFVVNPFGEESTFDFDAFKKVCAVATRMLDNVLDVTIWPLPQQQEEAANKRRIGLGFTGLGDALVMMGLRYDSEAAREMASMISAEMRDSAYEASVELARERGAFPLFNADMFLSGGRFASRLPKKLRDKITKHGLRNSHLLSIAPTGTISLAFADNASNGIEPAFSWTYTRKKRMPDGSHKLYAVEDHAWRLYRHLKGESTPLTPAFVTALELTASAHASMVAAVAPFIDTAISKTVNVPADYPYEDFQGLYLQAWKAGLKGLATYRPNSVLGSVLSVDAPAAPATPAPAPALPAVAVMADVDPLRLALESRPDGALEGVTSKVVYWTNEGKQCLYLTVNFAIVRGILNGKEVEIERPVELFIPSSQMGNGQQWISSHMMQMSLSARYGAPVAKSLANMRKVAWEKGNVRCGSYTKPDGSKVPRFHDSDVAAIGYTIQQILLQRGFLDDIGNQVPVERLVERLAQRRAGMGVIGDDLEQDEVVAKPAAAHSQLIGSGRKCPECGSNSLHKRDGCEQCEACGHVGVCG